MMLLILLIALQLQGSTLEISSPDFVHEGEIPPRFTCDGEDINPTLNIRGIPEGTKSLVIIMEDPDVPLTTFNHWLVWNIEPQETLEEGQVRGTAGNNSLGKNAYMGPCPPAGSHRYFFKIYALNTMLDLDDNSNKNRLENAMEGHILATGEIMGRYKKKE